MNFQSPEWVAVREEINRRITDLDMKNRVLGPEQTTSHLRGQITALTSLLDWERESAIPTEEEIVFS